MINHSRLTHIPHLKENLFAVNSAELEADIAFIRANKISSLNLNGRPNGQYAFNHIDWLEEICEQVQQLIITTPTKGDFSFAGLRFCKKLRFLVIFNYASGLIDLSNNIGLQTIQIEASKSLVGLEKLEGLNSAVLNQLPIEFQNSAKFSRLQNLDFLCISKSDVSNGVSFLADTKLKKLCFYGCKKLNLTGVEKIELSELKIEKSKNIQSFDEVFNINSLTQLSLIDSDNIPNAETILKLKNLKTLIVLGSSQIIDGDIAKLSGRLQTFNFDNKKHYNIKWRRK